MYVTYGTGFVTYFYASGQFGIQPSAFLTACAAAIAFTAGFRLPVLQRSVLMLITLLFGRVVAALLIGGGSRDVPSGVILTYGASATFAVAVLVGIRSRRVFRFCCWIPPAAVWSICVALNLWEWKNPGYFSNVNGRSSGWLENANVSALAIVLTAPLLIARGLPMFAALAIGALSFLGIYTTLSRGGVILLLSAGMVYLATSLRLRLSGLTLPTMFACAIAFVLFSLVRFDRAYSDTNVETRETQITGRSSLDVTSDARYELLISNVGAFLKRPLSGYGWGASLDDRFQPHNQFLGVAIEFGVVGLLLYFVAIFCLAVECYRGGPLIFAGWVTLFGSSFFSHNLLEDKSFLFAWIVLARLADIGTKKKGSPKGSVTTRCRGTSVLDAPCPAVR
jgi:hypothetical protein